MQNREGLEISILEAIEDMKNSEKNNAIISKGQTVLKDYIPQNQIKSILTGVFPLQNILSEQLYFVAQFLQKEEYFKEDIKNYFSEDEIASLLNFRYEIPIISNIITFNNVLKSEFKEEYTCRMTYEQIAQLYRAGVFIYNNNTQRISKIGKRNNTTFKIANINMSAIKAIKNEVLDGKFQSNMITLNIRNTGSENYEYVTSQKLLSVDISQGETFIDVIDGWHRISAIYEAYLENPNINGDMIITIKNLDIEQARLFINQESKGTLNNQSGIEYYDSDNNIVKLIEDININGNNKSNVLFNRITTATHSSPNSFIPYEILAENINIVWGALLNQSNTVKLISIKRYIIDFYNLFYDYTREKFKLPDNIKSYNLGEYVDALQDPMFVSGISILAYSAYKKSKNTDDIIEFLQDVFETIDFDISNKANYYTYSLRSDKPRFNKYVKSWRKEG